MSLTFNSFVAQNGYKWIQYVSFEHELENRKSTYYHVLRSCQAQRTKEDITDWVLFFLDCLKNIQQQLLNKLECYNSEVPLSAKAQSVYSIIQNPALKSLVLDFTNRLNHQKLLQKIESPPNLRLYLPNTFLYENFILCLFLCHFVEHFGILFRACFCSK